MKGSVYLFQKIGNIIRSSDNSKWQAFMRETDADRSWQAGHDEPWTRRRDAQGRSNARQSCLVAALHSDAEDLQAHVLAHSSEWENSDSEGDASKVETQKRKQSVHAYFRKKKRSILRSSHLLIGVAHAGEEGRINVLPWYRLVGVAKTSSQSHKEEVLGYSQG